MKMKPLHINEVDIKNIISFLIFFHSCLIFLDKFFQQTGITAKAFVASINKGKKLCSTK